MNTFDCMDISITQIIQVNKEPEITVSLYCAGAITFFNPDTDRVDNYPHDHIKLVEGIFKNDKNYPCVKVIPKLESLKNFIDPVEYEECMSTLKKYSHVDKNSVFFNIWWRWGLYNVKKH